MPYASAMTLLAALLLAGPAFSAEAQSPALSVQEQAAFDVAADCAKLEPTESCPCVHEKAMAAFAQSKPAVVRETSGGFRPARRSNPQLVALALQVQAQEAVRTARRQCLSSEGVN